MANRFLSKIVLVVLVAMLFPLMSVVADEGTQTVGIVPVKSGKIGVMPFMAGKFHANIDDIVEKTISCSISQLCFEPQDIKLGAEKQLTEYVTEYLRLRLDPATLIPSDETTKAYNMLSTDENKDTLRSLAVRFGKQLNVDYVLVGTVWRYRDRSQQEEAFDRQASVAFVVYLVGVSDGKRMWKGYYDKSQGALTDDLSNAPLFFKGGGKWLTAKEIAKIAVKDAFESFPFDRVKGVGLNSSGKGE